MIPWEHFICPFLFTVVTIMAALRSHALRARTTERERLASQFGLVREGQFLTGSFRGVQVTLLSPTSFFGSSINGTVVEAISTRLPWNVRIGTPDNVLFVTPTTSQPVHSTGDPEFDSAASLAGPESLVAAAMNWNTRKLAIRLLRDGGYVAWGRIHLQNEASVVDTSQLEALLTRVVELLRALDLPPEEVPHSLARNSLADPVPDVRLRNLGLLHEYFPKLEVTHRALREAMKDSDTRVRLLAARHAGGDEAKRVLESLAKDRALPSAQRSQALKTLVEVFGPEASTDAIFALLAPGESDEVLRFAVDTAARAGLSFAFDKIGNLLNTAPPLLLEAIAEALAALGKARATPILLGLLHHDSSDVRKAAAVSLGRVGTIEAVEPLLLLSREGLIAGDLQETARDAVRQIQNRLGDAEEGRLSLSPLATEAGGLSVADGAGGVSIADEASRANTAKEPLPGSPRRSRE